MGVFFVAAVFFAFAVTFGFALVVFDLAVLDFALVLVFFAVVLVVVLAIGQPASFWLGESFLWMLSPRSMRERGKIQRLVNLQRENGNLWSDNPIWLRKLSGQTDSDVQARENANRQGKNPIGRVFGAVPPVRCTVVNRSTLAVKLSETSRVVGGESEG